MFVELRSKHYTSVPNCYYYYHFWKVLGHFSHVQLFVSLDCSPSCSSVHGFLQARILEMLLCPLQGIFLTQVWNPSLLMPPELTGRFFTTSTIWEAQAIFGSTLLKKVINFQNFTSVYFYIRHFFLLRYLLIPKLHRKPLDHSCMSYIKSLMIIQWQ